MQIKFTTDRNNRLNLLDFIWQQKSLILSTFLVILVGSLGLSRMIGGLDKKLNDFYESGLYQAKVNAQKEVNVKELAKMIQNHKELAPIFNHYLQQNYILNNEIESAKKISQDSLKRLNFIHPLYLDFAKVSLLIDQFELKRALILSKELEIKLLDSNQKCLTDLNKVRILFLEKQLDPQSFKKEEWECLRANISPWLQSHFSEDQVSIFDM
jgi:hypothetical protein